MADDENLEEFNESTGDPEALAGFDEGETGDGTDKKPEGEGQEDKAGEGGEGEGSETEGKEEVEDKEDKPEGDEKDKGGEEKKEKTAAERAEERALKFKDGEGEDDPDKNKEKTGEEEDDPDKGKPSSLTKEQVKDLLSIVTDEDLPGEIVIGDDTVDLKALKESYPDDFNSIKVLAGITAQKIAKKMIDEGGYVKAADVQKQMQEVGTAMAQYEFWDEVRDVHADGKKIAKSPEFKEWVGKQSKHIQGLYRSGDAEDAISLLDFYKEDQAKKAAKDHDDELKNKKKKKDGLHGEGMRTKPNPPKSGSENDKDDIQAGFEEEVEEQRTKR